MFFEFVGMMKVCVVSKLTVDKWRVVLKGENPDYIHATSVHVSENLGVYTSSECDSGTVCVCVCVLCVCVCVLCVCRDTSSREHSSSLRGRCDPQQETSGRWSTVASVVWLSCSLTQLSWRR